ncbi:MAG: beta-glycosidase [Prevotella sp.]|nr:beta-glycosidase [Prevotella sp.]
MRKTTLLLLCMAAVTASGQQRISLAGEWRLQYDDVTTTVTLPGTMDTNKKGHSIEKKDETTRLSRLYSYKGKAWYERPIEIPRAWKGRQLTLLLERTKPSWLYIDGRLVDSCNNISTPQRYTLKALKPGRHTVRLLVDNGSGVPEQVYGSSHAYTEDTQTNWNGVIGEMYLAPTANPSRAQDGRDRQPTAAAAMPRLTIAPTGNGRTGFYADGHRVFLRGKHDACVWPLTGHCPMDVASWRQYLATCQEYGINHVRFHSWCPPEAAFTAADELGIYLQPELPFWGDFNAKDSVLMTFLHKEGENILREYSHHPSFAMFALGNELWGSIDEMARFVSDFRQLAPHVLYTFGSNYYLGYQGVKQGMDYFTTCRVGGEAWGTYDTHTRGSFSYADAKTGGMLNTEYPNTRMTLDKGCSRSSVPVISHETGQFQTYPDFDEIGKYTGVLYPYNMEVFRARLDSAGMLSQAKDFHVASGLWSLELYKADIELDLRTESMAGFQLLDLQDYPGQGSAYVGILDAFMEPKPLCTVRQWRQWCNDVVPLAIMPGYTFTSGQQQDIEVKVANYSGRSLAGQSLFWSIGNMEGDFTLPDGEGLLTVGTIHFEAPVLHTGWTFTLSLYIADTEYHNTYTIWVYPQKVNMDDYGIVTTRQLTPEIGRQLEQGATVLWMPDSTQLQHNTVGPLFQTDYWNYRMFKTICENNRKPVSPGTLGILTNPQHQLFCEFPTDEHTNWQWFPIIHHSRPAILDNLPRDYRPIVQVIDNVERNHRLGLVFEFAVGEGRLLVCMSDLECAREYPEGRQFYVSLLRYMQSDDFRPQLQIGWRELLDKLSGRVEEQQLKQLNNISQY